MGDGNENYADVRNKEVVMDEPSSSPVHSETPLVCSRCLGDNLTAGGAVGTGAFANARGVDGEQNASRTGAGSVIRASNGTQTETVGDTVVNDDVCDHETSLICARMVASSWAAASGILTKEDGGLEINESKTPELMRWRVRDGVKKGTYLLRGTKSCINGDIKMALTMDELFNAMSRIKDPNCGKGDAAHFMDESDIEESRDSLGNYETYQPG